MITKHWPLWWENVCVQQRIVINCTVCCDPPFILRVKKKVLQKKWKQKYKIQTYLYCTDEILVNIHGGENQLWLNYSNWEQDILPQVLEQKRV